MIQPFFFFRLSSTLANDCGRSSQGKRLSVRKQWTSENMEKAMKAVFDGMSITTASRTLAVPRKTLDDRVKGRVIHGKSPGLSTALSQEEEKSLKEYILYMSTSGFPLTRTMMKAFAWAIAKRSNTDTRLILVLEITGGVCLNSGILNLLSEE